MPIYVFVRLEPRPGKEQQLVEELQRVRQPTSEEPGCVRIHLFSSLRQPQIYYIHSVWVDEAAFDLHATYDYTVRFLAEVEQLITHPFQAVRTSEIL